MKLKLGLEYNVFMIEKVSFCRSAVTDTERSIGLKQFQRIIPEHHGPVSSNELHTNSDRITLGLPEHWFL